MNEEKKKIKQAAVDSVESMADFYEKTADAIWENPELSLKEFAAAKLYCDILRAHGFEVKECLAGVKTAFCGSFGHGRPVIGVLGEFDALSGLSQEANVAEPKPIVHGGSGHGCGHNLLGVGALSAAFAVKKYLEDSGSEGTVIFFGCPGEEGGSGKAYMAREGLWRKLDAAVSWHPSDVNQVRTGTNNSSIQVLYKFKGVAAHAASAPEYGRSALDAVELMNVGVQFLREHMSGDCRIHYAITNAGGISPNVVQSEAEVLYMVRANSVRRALELQKRVDKQAQGAATMTETEVERVFIDGTSELLPNFALEKLLYKNFKEVGVPTHTPEEETFAGALRATFPQTGELPGIGAQFDANIAAWVREKTDNLSAQFNDFLMPQYSGMGFIPGSTDVGDVSWQTPATQIEVVTWPSCTPGHTWQTVACGKSSAAYKGMLCAGKVLASAVIDLIEEPETLSAVREEFTRRSASGYVCPIEDGAVPTAL